MSYNYIVYLVGEHTLGFRSLFQRTDGNFFTAIHYPEEIFEYEIIQNELYLSGNKVGWINQDQLYVKSLRTDSYGTQYSHKLSITRNPDGKTFNVEEWGIVPNVITLKALGTLKQAGSTRQPSLQ